MGQTRQTGGERGRRARVVRSPLSRAISETHGVSRAPQILFRHSRAHADRDRTRRPGVRRSHFRLRAAPSGDAASVVLSRTGRGANVRSFKGFKSKTRPAPLAHTRTPTPRARLFRSRSLSLPARPHRVADSKLGCSRRYPKAQVRSGLLKCSPCDPFCQPIPHGSAMPRPPIPAGNAERQHLRCRASGAVAQDLGMPSSRSAGLGSGWSPAQGGSQ